MLNPVINQIAKRSSRGSQVTGNRIAEYESSCKDREGGNFEILSDLASANEWKDSVIDLENFHNIRYWQTERIWGFLGEGLLFFLISLCCYSKSRNK